MSQPVKGCAMYMKFFALYNAFAVIDFTEWL